MCVYGIARWNRLVGVWYNAGRTSDEAQRVVTHRYDGLPALDDAQCCQGFRRTEKIVANHGVGVACRTEPRRRGDAVHRAADDGGSAIPGRGRPAGDRFRAGNRRGARARAHARVGVYRPLTKR